MKTKILAAITVATILALTALIFQSFPGSAAQAQTPLTVQRSADRMSATATWTPNQGAEYQAFFVVAKLLAGEPDTTGYGIKIDTFRYVDYPLAGDVGRLVITELDPSRGYFYGAISTARDSSGNWVWSPWEIVQDATPSTDTGSLEMDSAALIALYNATDGDNWADNTNWLTDKPLAEWFGVTTDGDGRVVRLNLGSNNLSGSIPPELGKLSKLTYLRIPSNQLSGPIPSELGKLSSLTYLSLSRNQLSGPIPSELGKLSSLTILALSRNQLLEPIPSELGRLTNLEHLSFFGNQLSGEVPLELGNLTSLKSLALHDNQLTGSLPQGITAITGIEDFSFGHNDDLCAPTDTAFTAWIQAIPEWSGPDCEQVKAIAIASDRAALVALYNATDGDNWRWNFNWVSDEPLSEWTGVTTNDDGRVTRLDINRNNLSGAIPPELGRLFKLEYLSLTRSQLSGSIPPELGRLFKLEYLSLTRNQLASSIPPELGNLSNLEILSLSSNQLSGSIPTELGKLSNLTELWLWGNDLSGDIPSALSELSNLEILSLQNNGLTSEIPSELGNLTNLEDLLLAGNDLSGAIPSELGSLSNLEFLSLSGNDLTGCIPNVLGDTWSNDLSELGLSFCASRASDPADRAILEAFYNATGGANWSTSTNWLTNQPMGLWYGVATDSDGRVTGLTLVNNQLSGSIPIQLGNLTNMEYLRLVANELSGSIPTSLGNLTNLKRLYLFSNQLTGNIPASLGNLADLTDMYLDRNQLDGEVPASLGNLANLRNLSLYENRLSGSLPQELTKLTDLENFYFWDNPQLCAPEDEAFQTWLQGLDYWSGNGCAALADRAVLETLYHATDGPNWSTSTNWLSDRPLWEWHNVGINEEGRVTGLWLGGNQLSGEIPPDLGKLTKLSSLVLDHNDLRGNIPPELGNLANLRYLELHRNQLRGSIPPKLGDMNSLVHLQLGGNQLDGSIPHQLGNLAKLEGLYLWENSLNGNIPPELGKLANLTGLSLNHNQLEGAIPPELGRLTNLMRLWLHRNQLEGAIPQSLTAITGLERFHFSDNDGLCAPTDTAFQTWLQAIHEWSGPDCEQVKAIASDRAALVALYNATDGPNWTDNTNWLSDEPLGEWYPRRHGQLRPRRPTQPRQKRIERLNPTRTGRSGQPGKAVSLGQPAERRTSTESYPINRA